MAEILRAIYVAQADIEGYIALAEQAGLNPEDCLAVAKLLVPREPKEALAWVERGRALDGENQFRSKPLPLIVPFSLPGRQG